MSAVAFAAFAACADFEPSPITTPADAGPDTPAAEAGAPADTRDGSASPPDAPVDAAPAECSADWNVESPGTLIPGLPPGSLSARFSQDELTVVFQLVDDGAFRIAIAERLDRSAAFGAHAVLGPAFNEAASRQVQPSLSNQGRRLTFTRIGAGDAFSVWTAERPSTASAFPAPELLEANASRGFYIESESSFFFERTSPDGGDIGLLERPFVAGQPGSDRRVHPDAMVREYPTWYEERAQELRYYSETLPDSFLRTRRVPGGWSTPLVAPNVSWVSPDGCREYGNDTVAAEDGAAVGGAVMRRRLPP